MGGVEGGVWKSTDYGLSWTNITDGKIPGIADPIGALAVAAFESQRHLCRNRRGRHSQRFRHRRRRLQDDRCRQDVVVRRLARHAHDHETRHRSAQHERRVCGVDGARLQAQLRARHLQDDRRRERPGARCSSSTTTPAASTSRWTPRNPNVLYAAMWQAQRLPWKLTSGGPGSGLYKTLDGGAHWTKISTNPRFCDRDCSARSASRSPRANPRIVYAIVQAHDGGVFRSERRRRRPGSTSTPRWKLRQRAFYYMAIFADPTNPQIAYAPKSTASTARTTAARRGRSSRHPARRQPHHLGQPAQSQDSARRRRWRRNGFR